MVCKWKQFTETGGNEKEGIGEILEWKELKGEILTPPNCEMEGPNVLKLGYPHIFWLAKGRNQNGPSKIQEKPLT